MDTVIFDIDGTLANIDHRLKYVENGQSNWKEFFATISQDKPNEDICFLFRMLRSIRPSLSLIIVTGRPHSTYLDTTKWLSARNIVYDKIFMRKDNDFRRDHIVKKEILDEIRSAGHVIRLVIDDCPEVVQMWRNEGLTCLQTKWHGDHKPRLLFKNDIALTLLIGPCAAGKSTYAAKNFNPGEVLSSDDFRRSLTGYIGDQSKNDEVFAAMRAILKVRLEHGLHTVIDATNLRARDRKAFTKLAPPNVLIRYVVINRPLEMRLQDKEWRSEDLIIKHDQRFKQSINEIYNRDGNENVVLEWVPYR